MRAGGVGFKFLAQVRNINTQVMGVFVVALSPNFPQYLAVGDDLSGVADQKLKKIVLGNAEFYFPAIDSNATGGKVHDQLSRPKYDRIFLAGCMEQSHSKPRQQLAGVEWL